MITEPGFFKVAAEEYHLDPCPTPSLSSSIARIMLTQSPRHAWTAHPRLNDHWESGRGAIRLDVGTCAHEMMLDDGRGIVILDFPDYRTKAAREARQQAYDAGRTPVLKTMADEIVDMCSVANDYLRRSHIDWPAMESEQSFFWRDMGGVWCRAMTDKISPDRRFIIDYKTTSGSVSLEQTTRRAFANGYHIQQAFYERGLDILDPEGAGRRAFQFLFQETTPPYACQLAWFDATAMEFARRMVETAVIDWTHCLTTSQWPAYPPHAMTMFMPPWMQGKAMLEELSEEPKKFDPEVFNAG